MKISNIKLSYEDDRLSLSAVNLPLDRAIFASPFVLKSAEGLGPPEIHVGRQGVQPQNREIVLRIGFQPNYGAGLTVADLRSRLYKLLTMREGFPMTVSLQNEARDTLAKTTGSIKRLEPNIFSQDPEVSMTISCDQAYLTNWGQRRTDVDGLPTNLIQLLNVGDAPSGFAMRLRLTSFSEGFLLTDLFSDTFDFSFVFQNDDVIEFDTTPGMRMARVVREHTTTSLLSYKTVSAKWLQLYNGENILRTNLRDFIIEDYHVNENYWGV